MMFRFLIPLLLVFQQVFSIGFDPLLVSRANKAKEQAEEAFISKKYDVAISRYKYLLDTLKVKDDKALLNLAHSYMRKADYVNALDFYTQATKSLDNKIRSIGYQQLGILQAERKNREEAQNHFKSALKSDPSNMQARFNYELMLKNKDKDVPKSQDQKEREEQEKKNEEQKKKDQEKKKDGQKKGDQDQKNKESDKKDDQNKNGQKGNKNGKNDLKEKDKQGDKGEKGDSDQKKEEEKAGDKKGDSDKGKPSEDKKEGGDKGKEQKPDEKGDKQGQTEKPSEKGDQKKNTQSEAVAVNKEQLQKMNMTEQQAKAILNAMRNGEVQYIQDMKRVPSKLIRIKIRKIGDFECDQSLVSENVDKTCFFPHFLKQKFDYLFQSTTFAPLKEK